jgi:hypothetical protein
MKAESWVPISLTLEYMREQREGEPLQAVCARVVGMRERVERVKERIVRKVYIVN